jgi:serine/threonine protein kinase
MGRVNSVSLPAPSISADETAPQGKEPVGPPAGDPMLGRVIAGRFTVLGRLGAGAMGTVYRAKQARIGREVAIKILRSDRALDEASRARFLREARANSLLTSPNTVTVFDFGADDRGDFYLAMELLEGESLGQRLRRKGRLDAAAAVDTARQALRSLAEAHAKGIVHRDLKPDNLFYARARAQPAAEEMVKVLDFGVAKMIHADAELAMNAVETQAGTVFGTPRYMSPEQAQGRALDTRSDLYSLGVILYQMLTGRPPFTDDDAVVVMARHIKTPARPMSEAAPEACVPAELEAVVMKALSKDPDQRAENADAMAAELAHALELAGPAASPVSSGVRISIPPGVSSAVPAIEARVVKPSSPVPESAAAGRPDDAADVAMQVAALRPRRWPFVFALVAAAAAISGLVFNETRDTGHDATGPHGPAAPAAESQAEPVVDHSRAMSPEPSASAPSTPRPMAAVTAPSSKATPATSSIALPPSRLQPPTVRRGSNRSDTSASPASTSSGSTVGYGYLE